MSRDITVHLSDREERLLTRLHEWYGTGGDRFGDTEHLLIPDDEQMLRAGLDLLHQVEQAKHRDGKIVRFVDSKNG